MVLKLIALLILICSVVTFVIQCVKGTARSSFLFAATAILSVVLFMMADLVQEKELERRQALSEVMPASPETAPDAAGTDTVPATGDGKAGDNVYDFADSADQPSEEATPPSPDAAEVPSEVPAPDAAEAPSEVPSPDAAEAPSEVPSPDAAEVPSEVPSPDAAEVPSPDAAEEPSEVPSPDAADAPSPDAAEEPDPLAPVAIAGDPIDDVKVKEAVVFNASRSKKNKASIKTYHWDFGDGATADTAKASHAYAEAGTYIAVLTIEDANGHKASATRTVEVNRPEAKQRFTQKYRRITDIVSSTSMPAEITETVAKQYTGSAMTLEAKAYLESAEGCTCSISVSITGPGCQTAQTKKVADGGLGDVSARVSCKGDVGDYIWSFKRMNSDACACTWKDVKLDGYEN